MPSSAATGGRSIAPHQLSPETQFGSAKRLRVFVSYAHGQENAAPAKDQDEQNVGDLVSSIRKLGSASGIESTGQGIDIFFDRDVESLAPGDSWLKKLESFLTTCDIVLICFSRHAVIKAARHDSFFRNEIDIASTVAQQPETPLKIIPIKLEPCTIPASLNLDQQYAELYKPDGFDRVLFAIELAFQGRSESERRAICWLPRIDFSQLARNLTVATITLCLWLTYWLYAIDWIKWTSFRGWCLVPLVPAFVTAWRLLEPRVRWWRLYKALRFAPSWLIKVRRLLDARYPVVLRMTPPRSTTFLLCGFVTCTTAVLVLCLWFSVNRVVLLIVPGHEVYSGYENNQDSYRLDISGPDFDLRAFAFEGRSFWIGWPVSESVPPALQRAIRPGIHVPEDSVFSPGSLVDCRPPPSVDKLVIWTSQRDGVRQSRLILHPMGRAIRTGAGKVYVYEMEIAPS